MPRPYHHTETITFPLGTPAAAAKQALPLFPKEYKKCIGVLVYPHQASNTVRLGLAIKSDDIIQLTHPDHWKSSSNIAYKDRPIPVEFSVEHEITLNYHPIAALLAAETIDMVFILE